MSQNVSESSKPESNWREITPEEAAALRLLGVRLQFNCTATEGGWIYSKNIWCPIIYHKPDHRWRVECE